MDFGKFKWKMQFRKKKLKGFFSLCKYEFLHRFHMEGGEEHIHYVIRQTLWDLVKADPEQEYLEVHGLLPEVDEAEEPEAEPEAEPEEPGLIRKVELSELLFSSQRVGSEVYCLAEVKEYGERTQITMQIMDESYEFRDEECAAPHEDGARYDAFACNGESWRWDRADTKLRHCPVVYEDAAMAAQQGAVRVVQELVLRVDKALAEESLSPLCLEYAYQNSEEGYDWCVGDHSHLPVLYELKMAATAEAEREIKEEIGLYCLRYWEEAGVGEQNR